MNHIFKASSTSRNGIFLVTMAFQLFTGSFVQSLNFTRDDLLRYREKTKQMFDHAYRGYMSHAYPYDELKPISCTGHDTWGSFSLTLIDTLDTLVVLNHLEEFRRAAELILTDVNFDSDINVSVFETNIRVVGGLLAAHLFSKKANFRVEAGWPCEGPLLRMAEDVASRLLPAFKSSTGMPYGTVNLRYGVPKGETPVSCTACVGTFIIEFGTLSRLTGDQSYEKAAKKALDSLWNRKSVINLVGNHIDVETGKWTALDAGIGAGVDSYFEYLVKGSLLFQDPMWRQQFDTYKSAVVQHTKRDDWYMWVNMAKGTVTLPIFQSLEAFWPGLQSLIGESREALRTMHNYFQVWQQYGFHPEFYNVPKAEVYKNRDSYPLRPEFSESLMYLYQVTKDPMLLEMGATVLESIEKKCKTDCGYAVVENVHTHKLGDRMESFFLSETLKYLYLLFDPTHFIHNSGARGETVRTAHGECVIDAGGYVFNTEGHPIDAAALDCCHNPVEGTMANIQESLDLASLVGSSASKRDVNDRLQERTSPTDDTRVDFTQADLKPALFSLLDEALAMAKGNNSSKVADQNALADKVMSYIARNQTTWPEKHMDPHDHKILSCPHQPFGLRYSLYGEV